MIQAWILKDAVVDEEVHKAREKAKVDILRMLNGDDLSDYLQGANVGIVYDDSGAPRPARMAYDGEYSDDPPAQRQTAVRPLPPETVPTGDYDNPFPGLDKPLG